MSRAALIALAAVAAPGLARATPESDADDRCKAAVEKRTLFPTQPLLDAAKGHYCDVLANDVLSKLRERAREPPHAIKGLNPAQPTITDTAGAQASAGQASAIASGQPVATAGGDVAAVGDTGQGLQLVTALAINPASIAIGDHSTRSMWASRLADVSLLLPLAVDPAAGTKQGFPYVGVRFRINALPALHRDKLEATVAAATKELESTSALAGQVSRLVGGAADAGACADAVEADDHPAELRVCGAEVDVIQMLDFTKAARRALGQVREDADQAYLTLEGRYDRGDVNSDAADRKDSLLAAYLAAGYRIDPTPEGVTVGLRARGGFVYFKDGMTRQTRQALYGAAGVELAIVRDLQRYTLSLGAELVGHKGAADVAMDSTLHNAIRIGLGLPVADGRTVTVGLSIPTNGDDVTIAISGDWSLLLDR